MKKNQAVLSVLHCMYPICTPCARECACGETHPCRTCMLHLSLQGQEDQFLTWLSSHRHLAPSQRDRGRLAQTLSDKRHSVLTWLKKHPMDAGPLQTCENTSADAVAGSL
ncbi:tRNA N6-adenosine threonylcarbamoyltransferase [Clarias magur]|uniref:tRNA N6-adenosine threonylcarbamoyltransferase n=1 Tax=Clarias magur TaxID=1594786 RepID=A0A8J4WRL8_CLAMG|nr:tRNA N6-adenosine threonylcarbamoyltransferase [Clarias magur]